MVNSTKKKLWEENATFSATLVVVSSKLRGTAEKVQVIFGHLQKIIALLIAKFFLARKNYNCCMG